MEFSVSRVHRFPLIGAALTLIVYGAMAALLYQGLEPSDSAPCLIWLPSGVGLAAVILWGWSMSVPVFAASAIFMFLMTGASPLQILLVSLFNALGPLVGGGLVRLSQSRRLPVCRMADAIRLLGLGIGVSALISAFGGLADLALRGADYPLASQYIDWLMADMAGAAACAPLMLCAMAGVRNRANDMIGAGFAEAILVCLLTVGLAGQIFFGFDDPEGRYLLWPTVLMLPLLWASTRLPLLLAHLLGTLVMMLAIVASAKGTGAFHVAQPGLQGDSTALFILVQSSLLLIIGAQVTERRDAEETTRQTNIWLEHKVAERSRALAESEARFRQLADTAPIPLAVSRFSDGSVLYLNEKSRELFRIDDSPFSLRVDDFYASRQAREHVLALLDEFGCLQDYEMLLQDSQGRQFWALISCTLIRRDGEKQIIIGVSDISNRKVMEESLQMANQALQEHLVEVESRHEGLRDKAMRDPLTGLFNRRFLDEILPERVATALVGGRQLVIVMIDVDHFKSINDTWGHRGGDDVLSMLGSYLAERFRSTDLVCRYGGEEFVVVMPDTSLEMAMSRAHALCDGIRSARFFANGHAISITLSIGIAALPLHSVEATTLVQRADEALYQAKRAGRNRVVMASYGMDEGMAFSGRV